MWAVYIAKMYVNEFQEIFCRIFTKEVCAGRLVCWIFLHASGQALVMATLQPASVAVV